LRASIEANFLKIFAISCKDTLTVDQRGVVTQRSE